MSNRRGVSGERAPRRIRPSRTGCARGGKPPDSVSLSLPRLPPFKICGGAEVRPRGRVKASSRTGFASGGPPKLTATKRGVPKPGAPLFLPPVKHSTSPCHAPLTPHPHGAMVTVPRNTTGFGRRGPRFKANEGRTLVAAFPLVRGAAVMADRAGNPFGGCRFLDPVREPRTVPSPHRRGCGSG